MRTKYMVSLTIILNLLAIILACQPGSGSSSQKSEQTTTANKGVELSQADIEEYKRLGMKVSMNTFTTLSQTLSKAIGEGGIGNAIQYCNLAALPMVDSLSQINNAEIRRASMKPRNPKDAPTPEERKILERYHKIAAEGESPEPVVQREGDKIAYYSPIVIKPLCLNCHGQVGTEVSDEDYAQIQALYPEDKAIGYKLGDLRGIWSIKFK